MSTEAEVIRVLKSAPNVAAETLLTPEYRTETLAFGRYGRFVALAERIALLLTEQNTLEARLQIYALTISSQAMRIYLGGDGFNPARLRDSAQRLSVLAPQDDLVARAHLAMSRAAEVSGDLRGEKKAQQLAIEHATDGTLQEIQFRACGMASRAGAYDESLEMAESLVRVVKPTNQMAKMLLAGVLSAQANVFHLVHDWARAKAILATIKDTCVDTFHRRGLYKVLCDQSRIAIAEGDFATAIDNIAHAEQYGSAGLALYEKANQAMVELELAVGYPRMQELWRMREGR